MMRLGLAAEKRDSAAWRHLKKENNLRGIMTHYFTWDNADEEEKAAKRMQNFYKQIVIKNGCWKAKSKFGQGYGRCGIDKKKYELLHRASYKIHIGKIPEGMQINHRCHNPECCRPSHLYLGTQKENIEDQIKRGTFSKGSKHWKSKIDEKQASQIKKYLKEKKLSHRDIALRCGTTRNVVKDISRGRTWKDTL